MQESRGYFLGVILEGYFMGNFGGNFWGNFWDNFGGEVLRCQGFVLF